LAATFLSRTVGALGVAPLSAPLTQRTAIQGDALLPLVNVAGTDGNLALQDASRGVVYGAATWISQLFLFTGLPRPRSFPAGNSWGIHRISPIR